VVKFAELAACMPWDAAIWHKKATKWTSFCFGVSDKRVAYYDARDVDAGQAVLPLLEEEIKARIVRELPPMPVAEYIKHGARVPTTRYVPQVCLYKQVFPGKGVAVGYQEVDVLEPGSSKPGEY
jgi:hypothetical protein